MTILAPLQLNGHLAQNFARSIAPSATQVSGHNEHPQGRKMSAPRNDGKQQGAYVRAVTEYYHVPDGSDPLFPVPNANEPIYVWRTQSGIQFLGGWMEASNFNGTGSIEARYINAQGYNRAIKLAGLTASVGGNSDAFFFESKALQQLSQLPISCKIDIVFLSEQRLTPGENFSLVFLYTS